MARPLPSDNYKITTRSFPLKGLTLIFILIALVLIAFYFVILPVLNHIKIK